jgi:RNA polymerase-associated protein CTR9
MKALRYYEKALKVDPRNIYAANGAGAIMAERGYTNEAREIFVQVCVAGAWLHAVNTRARHWVCSRDMDGTAGCV